MADAPQEVVVDVKSAWWSKVNWTQVIGITASVLVLVTGGKVNLSPSDQAVIVTLIQAGFGVATIVIKTWFTPTVTPGSIAVANPAVQP